MPDVITGQDGAISLGGGAVNGKVLEWRLLLESQNTDTSGAGDDWKSRQHIRSDWKATGRFYAYDQADWDLDQGLVGTNAAVALKRKSSDLSNYFSATGLVTECEVVHAHEDGTECTFTVECSQGTAPTFDTSPAT